MFWNYDLKNNGFILWDAVASLMELRPEEI
jgi:hypothetical protein